MLKNLKQDIKNIVILLFIVVILSLGLYLIIYKNSEYIKNIKLDSKTYDYNENNYKYNNESIKLDSRITLNDYILDLEFDEEDLIAINNYSNNIDTGISIYKINLEDDSITTKKTINKGLFTMYTTGNISPSKELIVYNTAQDSSKNIYTNSNSILYNLRDDKYISLPYYFELLSWLPDSSGFYGYKDGRLFLYDINKNKIIKTYELKNGDSINKVIFSQDGTKFYTLNSKKKEIKVYNLKNELIFEIKNIKSIVDFDIIDDKHLLIKGTNLGKKCIYLYDINKKSIKVLDKIHYGKMYLSSDKSKLVIVYYNGNNESTIDIYEIAKYNENIDFYKLGSIPIKGIPYVTISDNEKFAYFIEGSNVGESEICVYSILKNDGNS